ncbi:MAG TPA: DEAD/DEAH box helicase, partial [Acidimicrobiales bacterium]|nr:DEAD/DEAH box helicase [Acidimicrobiales bacterium]
RRLGDLTREELRARSAGDFAADLLADRRAVEVRIAGEARLIAAEDAGRYRDALGVHPPPGLPEVFLAPVEDPLGSLLGRFARTHGPFRSEEPGARFGLPVGVVESLLAARADTGVLLRGEFRPPAYVAERGLTSGPEWCDPEVLRQLRQRSLAALRKEVEPVDAGALAGFLPAWQGVGDEGPGSGQRNGGLDRLFEVVRQLQGVAIPASVLERDVLSARMADYSPRLLDELTAAGEVVWMGAGPLGRDDGKVMLFLRDKAPLLRPLPTGGRPEGEEHDRIREVLERRGACFFRELAGRDDKASLDALWDLVWVGEITNDSFAALRAFVGQGGRGTPSKRSGRPRLGSLTVLGPPKAQGRWSLVEADLPVDQAPQTQRAHALATALLDRHGVLTREAVRGEGHPGGFAGVYPVLRAMEESGRCRRGYFVAGLGGAQFALPGAVDRLRADRRSRSREALVLAATDPANAYGLSLPWPQRPRAGTRPENGPRRVAGAYVVLLDGGPCLYVEKGARGLVALRPYDGTWEEPAITALGGLVSSGRLRRLSVERYDEPLEPALRAAGFVPTPKGLVRYGA